MPYNERHFQICFVTNKEALSNVTIYESHGERR